MTVHIHSEDFSLTTGHATRYDGVWNLNKQIKGEFEVIDQYIDAQPIPWIMIGNLNNVDFSFNSVSVTFDLFDDPEVMGLETDITTIGTAIQQAFNDVADYYGNAFSMTVSIDETLECFQLEFSENVQIHYSDMELSHIIDTVSENEIGNTFLWSYANMETSPHLFVRVAEISSKILEKDYKRAALIFHTEDDPLIGMRVTIRNVTKQLTIKIYRKSIPNFPIQITNQWDVILQKLYAT
jgi:hypothetical protein